MVVEQRIGRLDRIGRSRPVEIVYFRPPAGHAALVADLYEQLGLFERPLGGVERELSSAEQFLEDAALADSEQVDPAALAAVVGRTREATSIVERAAFHELFRDPYRPALAPSILARIPPELEELTQDVVLALAEALRLHVEEHREGRRHSIELGHRASVESLPGVPPGASFLGTFDREEAVADESIDFFASGHPLVEGLLAHLNEAPLGRVGLLHLGGTGERGFGVLAIYKHGPGAFEAHAVDLSGRRRPEWAALLTARPLRTRRIRPEAWTEQPGWPEVIRGLAQHFTAFGRPVAVAAFTLEP
jgi:ATP-dependent helicase HepA